MTARLLLVAVAIATASQAARGQEPPRFEVVSIKPTPPGTTGGGFRVSPGGRVQWTNTTLKGLIASAFQRFTWDQREIVGGPPWLNDVRFDVVAQAVGGLPPADSDGFPSKLLAMTRALIEDHFKVVARWEARERPVFNLVLARKDARLGPQLKAVDIDCARVAALTLAGEVVPMRAGRGQECNLSLTADPGTIQANAIEVAVLARVLGPSGVNREVIDRTGLAGRFDVDLIYAPEFVGTLQAPGASTAAMLARPSIFAAIEEQLGLKLAGSRAQVQVLVIERAERPTEN